MKVISGKIVGITDKSKTKVYGYGGGGSVFNGSGHTSPITIGSRTLHTVQFWVEDETGQEHCFYQDDEDIPLREGQHVSVGIHDDEIVMLANHSARKYYDMAPKAPPPPKPDGFAEKAAGMFFIGWWLVMNIVFYEISPSHGLFSFFFGLLIRWAYRKFHKLPLKKKQQDEWKAKAAPLTAIRQSAQEALAEFKLADEKMAKA